MDMTRTIPAMGWPEHLFANPLFFFGAIAMILMTGACLLGAL